MAFTTASPRICRRPGRMARTAYLLIAPAVIAMLGFLVYPMKGKPGESNVDQGTVSDQ